MKDYHPRLIDKKVAQHLRIFGAVSIEGPKWCGKTWTSLNHAQSASFVTDKTVHDLAKVDPKYVFKDEKPQLIDEWQIVPAIWDAVRNECDSDQKKGKFILTGSTSLYDNTGESQVYHSGTGRISPLRMHPMSLYESGDSTGQASISDMLKGKINEGYNNKTTLKDLAHFIVRGGWPANMMTDPKDAGVIPESYIESIVKKDMNENRVRTRSPQKMRMLLRSLSRNESTVVSSKTLIKDIEEYENSDELIESRITLSDYLSVLDSLYMTANQQAFSINYRSSARVGKAAKRHLVDPSLCCASLHLTSEKLLHDFETFGLLFEALAERDLRIYAQYLEGELYHFRDNVSGDEVDAIIEFKDGNYGAFEIKLSERGIEEAIKSLQTFHMHAKRKPSFMCVIVGHLEVVMRDPKSGIFIIPLTALKP